MPEGLALIRHERPTRRRAREGRGAGVRWASLLAPMTLLIAVIALAATKQSWIPAAAATLLLIGLVSLGLVLPRRARRRVARLESSEHGRAAMVFRGRRELWTLKVIALDLGGMILGFVVLWLISLATSSAVLGVGGAILTLVCCAVAGWALIAFMRPRRGGR